MTPNNLEWAKQFIESWIPIDKKDQQFVKEAKLKARSDFVQTIATKLEEAIRLTWNKSAEGWNAEYTGVHYNVEEEVVKSVLAQLNTTSRKRER